MKFNELKVGDMFIVAQSVRENSSKNDLVCDYDTVKAVYVKTRINICGDKLVISNALRLHDGDKESFGDEQDVTKIMS